ncbi:MAG: hypothetical protein HRF43_18925, partial [Phycisphaerae bacterium]
DKSEITAAAEKMHKMHPAAGSFMPTLGLVCESLSTLASIDEAMQKNCPSHQLEARKASGQADAGENPLSCPVAAAAFEAAGKKMEQSLALVAKANELMLAAYNPAACDQACSKGEAKLTSADEKASACSGQKGQTAALTSAEEKKGTCTGEKAQTAALASAEKKSDCAQKAEAASLASAEKKSDCAGEKAQTAALASADKKGEACCEKTTKAALASDQKGDGCCAEKAKTAALAAGSEKTHCPKALSAKAEALVAKSGAVLAGWQIAGIRLAAMDAKDREAAEKLVQVVSTRCPKGAHMPETMATVAALLRDAATLSAQAQNECMKHEALAKMITPELKQLCEARAMTLSATINVLEKCCGAFKPSRQQVALAQ